MFKFKLTTLLIFIISISCLQAQENKKTQSIKTSTQIRGEDAAMLIETGTLLVEENGEAIVKFVAPARAIPKKYRDVDIRLNDKVIFINAHRVKKLKDFKAIYNELEIDAEIELGIERNSELLMLKFSKADPEKSKTRMKIRTSTDTK